MPGLGRQMLPFVLFFAGATASLSAQDVPAGGWHRVADDLEMKRAAIKPEALFAPELLFVRTSLKKYRVGVVRAQDFGGVGSTVRELCEKSKARLGVNASFFDENGRALGLVVSRGNLYQKVHRGGKTLTGVFQLTRYGIGIVQREDFRPEAAIEAVQAGPRLIIGGQAVHGLRNLSSHSRRAGVCIDEHARVLLYVSSGLAGIGISELQEILLSPEIACKDALNLDGGGSAQFFLSKELPGVMPEMEDLAIEGSENIPVMLGLFTMSNK